MNQFICLDVKLVYAFAVWLNKLLAWTKQFLNEATNLIDEANPKMDAPKMDAITNSGKTTLVNVQKVLKDFLEGPFSHDPRLLSLQEKPSEEKPSFDDDDDDDDDNIINEIGKISRTLQALVERGPLSADQIKEILDKMNISTKPCPNRKPFCPNRGDPCPCPTLGKPCLPTYKLETIMKSGHYPKDLFKNIYLEQGDGNDATFKEDWRAMKDAELSILTVDMDPRLELFSVSQRWYFIPALAFPSVEAAPLAPPNYLINYAMRKCAKFIAPWMKTLLYEVCTAHTVKITELTGSIGNHCIRIVVDKEQYDIGIGQWFMCQIHITYKDNGFPNNVPNYATILSGAIDESIHENRWLAMQLRFHSVEKDGVNLPYHVWKRKCEDACKEAQEYFEKMRRLEMETPLYPTAETPAETPAEPAAETPAEPAAESAAEPMTEPMTEPAAEQDTDSYSAPGTCHLAPAYFSGHLYANCPLLRHHSKTT